MSYVAIGEFLAHLIIVDDHIHADQVEMLREYVKECGLEGTPEAARIFSVLEGKAATPLNDIYSSLRELDDAKRAILRQQAAAIIGFNRHFAAEERAAIHAMCHGVGQDPAPYLNAIEQIIEHANQVRQNKIAQAENSQQMSNLSLKVRRFFSMGARREYLTTQIRGNELAGPEYAKAIREAGQIAEEDCQLVEQQLQHVVEALDGTRAKFQSPHTQAQRPNTQAKESKSTTPESAEAEAFTAFIKELNHSLDTEAQAAIDQLHQVVDRKRRAKNAFTIALMGRTKAGKSTLHFIMTGQGQEFIGVGAERTTRFNRVYEWENLKLIDTPGIGAAEAGGRSDEEIALSVVDTADVICYVVTSDSVQEVEFQFLEKIKDNNKPVFILLNHKENLQSPPPRYKRFLKNPLHWYERQDEQNLQGTINRIERSVANYYDGSQVKIIPVQLMAAKLAKKINDSETSSSEADALYSGSRIQHFYNEIRENVLEMGKLRKSQTLLENTSYKLKKMRSSAQQQRDKALRLAKDLNKNQKKILHTIAKQSSKSKSDFLRELASKAEFEKGAALDFANDNYTLSKRDIERGWDKEVERISSELAEQLRLALETSIAVVTDAVNEAIEDIEIGLDDLIKGGFSSYDTFNTRRLTSVLGTLVGVVGGILALTNPAGWVGYALIGAGIVIGFIANLFKSKEKKKSEAVENIAKQAKETIDKLQTSYADKAEEVFADFEQKATAAIDRGLASVADQFTQVNRLLEPYQTALEQATEALDDTFSARLAAFHANSQQSPAQQYAQQSQKQNQNKEGVEP